MNTTKELPIVRDAKPGLTRREAGRLLLACLGSGAFAWTTASHPIWKHLADGGLMDAAEADVSTGGRHFLSAAQYESLTRLAEAIVPGSNKARSVEFIDLLLSADTAKQQKEFGDSLSEFEVESMKRFGKKVSAIAATDLNRLLTDASTQPRNDKDVNSLRGAFENLKEWITGAYYSSEIGMKELGWTPDRVFAEFGSCTHSDHNS